ncbi:FliI/YscN family ATPase [Photobacterium sp. GJ3]|uniref:FliI/YscN family ATPase n=1 Tax=Photobacterium sp. GJ3 TaxID=2829502 RepID=UPI001B8BE5A6|nr:FliI/YscN family ATPase [Photobacterium sp. GJ3]QUJ68519.1 FliI/YscN family ATPase [Photobacterium sp. GJ3]
MQSNEWLLKLLAGIAEAPVATEYGRVVSVSGCFIEASHTGCVVGEGVTIFAQSRSVAAEVVSIQGDRCLLAPLTGLEGVGVGNDVEYKKQLPSAELMKNPFGKVLNGFGQDISAPRTDTEMTVSGSEQLALSIEPAPVHAKEAVTVKIKTGARIIDDIFPLGMGQKVGIFAGSGVGKSTLLNKLYQGMQADVKIIAMVGERSREVVDFYQEQMSSGDCDDTILIASTSDDSPSLKRRAVYVALAYARHFCAQGKNVLFVLDSITRLAHALREIGISRGEPPVARGYPPSVFAELPKIVELCGNFKNQGSITSIMSVLVDGDDENEPVSDFMRGVLDGHFMLDRKLSNHGLYPSINILKSRSRVMENLFSPDELAFEKKVRAIYSDYAEVDDVVRTGLYQEGSNDDIDQVIAMKRRLDRALYCWKNRMDEEVRNDVLRYE